MLASRLRSKAYDRLVIVAAPSALGDLRPAISEQVRAKVTGEVAKDLTKTPDGEVAGHFQPGGPRRAVSSPSRHSRAILHAERPGAQAAPGS